MISFTPAIYEHAAALIGRSPWDVSRDPELLFQAHRAAFLEYHHTPVVVGIDIYNLEAEAYGAALPQPSGNGIPAVSEHPFGSIEATRDMRPLDPARDGRIALFIEAGKRLAHELPEADVRIPVSGPFSIAASLRGVTGLCEDLLDYPEELADWLMRLAENQRVFCEAVVTAGLDIAFFESAAAPPIVSPNQFREIELPALKRAMSVASEAAGHPLPCIMGGNTYLILDDILSTGTGYLVCNVETDQKAFVDRVRECAPEVAIRVNMDPVIVAQGSPEEILVEVDRVIGIIDGYDKCVIGTGALPYEAPPENVHLVERHLANR